MPRDDVRDDALSSQRTARDAGTEAYRPQEPGDWPGSVDPGTVQEALDELADVSSSALGQSLVRHRRGDLQAVLRAQGLVPMPRHPGPGPIPLQRIVRRGTQIHTPMLRLARHLAIPRLDQQIAGAVRSYRQRTVRPTTIIGQVIARLIRVKAPASSGAQELSIAGGSSPAEDANAWAFDQTGPEYLDFYFRLSARYSGRGVTFVHRWSGAATTNNVRWGGAIRRLADGAETLSASHTYDFNDAADSAAPGTVTISKDTSVDFSDGADMDSLAAGEPFIYRARRTSATSNMAADAYLWDVECRER